MKFADFYRVRQRLVEQGALAGKESFRDYRDLFESESYMQGLDEYFSEEMDRIELAIACFEERKSNGTLNEKQNILQVLINYIRIKAMTSKYVKAMVDEGINDMDYERRKDAARKAGKKGDETENLKAAHRMKADALIDRVKAIADRIDTIAGDSDFLRKAAKKIKTVGRIKKNEILIKIASKEEAKELKLKNAELTKDIATIDNELREYEADNKEEIEAAVKKQLEELEPKIKAAKDKIRDIQSKINDLDDQLSESLVFEDEGKSDAEKAKIHAEIAKLKQQKLELLKTVLDMETQFNQLSKKDEFNVKGREKEIGNLEDDIKDHTTKAEKLGSKGGEDETTKPEKEKEVEKEVEPAKEPEKEKEAEPAKEPEKEKEVEKEVEPAKEPEKEKEAEKEVEPAKEPEKEKEAEPAKEPEKEKEAEPAKEPEPAKETETEQQKKEKAYKKEQAQKDLEGAKKALQKAKDEGKSEETIGKIQANIDQLQAKLDKLSESIEDFDSNLSEIVEGIGNVISMIENLNAPKSAYLTFSDFVSRRK